MDIMIECKASWHLAPALTISRALADYDIYWFEERYLQILTIATYAQYRGRVAGSENLGAPLLREALGRPSLSQTSTWVDRQSDGSKRSRGDV